MKNKQFSTDSVSHIEVGQEHDGQRIDNFLIAHLKGVPRTRVYRLIRKGEIRVNGGRAKASQRLVSGDKMRLPPIRQSPRPGSAEVPPAPEQLEQLRQRVLHEDDSVLIIDKPAGLAVHGGSGISLGVIEILRQHPAWAGLELAHRLDRATSGCLVLAKKRSMLRHLHQLLRDGEVEKDYLALVAGRWQLGRKWLDMPLSITGREKGERHVRVDPDGKPARTFFSPKSFFRGATLLSARLATGRTHQIRVHAAHVGHPLAGDQRYGDPDFNHDMNARGLRRMFLHAHVLSFTGPNGNDIVVSAALPDSLRQVLDRLEPVRG